MKKILVATVALTLGATAAFAGSIKGTKHDLSAYTTHGAVTSNSTQICVFCHTPHNAVVNSLLWNRSLPSKTYGVYTSSTNAAVRAVLRTASIGPANNSILCLSCHDSTLANLANNMGPSRGTTTDGAVLSMTDPNNTWTTVGAVAADAQSLTNDHPVGFDYAAAYAANTAGLYDQNVAATNMASTASSIFFSVGAKPYTMECASCHQVHDNVNGKFLRMTNAQSKLCLACHIK